MFHRGHVGEGVLQEGQQGGTGDDGFRGRVLGDVAHLGSLEQWKDGHDDGPGPRDRLVRNDDLRRIDHHYDDAVAFLDAERPQAGGKLRSFSRNRQIGILAYLFLLRVLVNQHLIGAEMLIIVDGKIIQRLDILQARNAFLACHAPNSFLCSDGTKTTASPVVTFSPFWFCAQHSSVIASRESSDSRALTTPRQVSVSPRRTMLTKRTFSRENSACSIPAICCITN